MKSCLHTKSVAFGHSKNIGFFFMWNVPYAVSKCLSNLK